MKKRPTQPRASSQKKLALKREIIGQLVDASARGGTDLYWPLSPILNPPPCNNPIYSA